MFRRVVGPFRLFVAAGALLAVTAGCGDDDEAGSVAADPVEFCRLNASIGEAAGAAGATDPTKALAVFEQRLGDIERQATIAPAELTADIEALLTATRKAIELDNIGTLLADGPAMAAKAKIDTYCQSAAAPSTT